MGSGEFERGGGGESRARDWWGGGRAGWGGGVGWGCLKREVDELWIPALIRIINSTTLHQYSHSLICSLEFPSIFHQETQPLPPNWERLMTTQHLPKANKNYSLAHHIDRPTNHHSKAEPKMMWIQKPPPWQGFCLLLLGVADGLCVAKFDIIVD